MVRVSSRLLLATLLCGGVASNVLLAAEARKPSLRLIYTANLRGVLDPCGCQAQQPGGLARRAAVLKPLQDDDLPTVTLDAGDNLVPGRPDKDMLSFVYTTLKQMNYDVAAVGPYDTTLPIADIRRAAEHSGLRIVPSPRRRGTDEPAFTLLKVGRWRIAVVGAGPL